MIVWRDRSGMRGGAALRSSADLWCLAQASTLRSPSSSRLLFCECAGPCEGGDGANQVARGIHGHPVCRRARCRSADCDDDRPQRAAVGRRELCLSDLAGRARGKDRILIFEDTDSDGRFDRRTVFFDQGTNFTGIELGFGGVWVCSTPNLLFIPDQDGDDRPDGPPVIKLDGWSKTPQHNMFNGLKWGPDGWLWGCNGILSISRVGKPGTPDEKRVAIDCGVWRYHPDAGSLRGRRSRNDQSLGARFRRPGGSVHHELRDPAPFSRRPRRTFSADVRRRRGSQSLRADGNLRRSYPLGRRALAGLTRRARASTARPAAATPTSGR